MMMMTVRSYLLPSFFSSKPKVGGYVNKTTILDTASESNQRGCVVDDDDKANSLPKQEKLIEGKKGEQRSGRQEEQEDEQLLYNEQNWYRQRHTHNSKSY